jgi:hypothetical protein
LFAIGTGYTFPAAATTLPVSLTIGNNAGIANVMPQYVKDAVTGARADSAAVPGAALLAATFFAVVFLTATCLTAAFFGAFSAVVAPVLAATL